MARARQLLTWVSLSCAVGVLSFTRIAEGGQGLDDAGPEVWVSGPTTLDVSGADSFPDVGVDERGRRIYVWTLTSDIALRRFDATGNDLEDPRLINTTTALTQDRPRVAVAADGSFLVIWQSSEDDGGTNRKWVRSRAFKSNGVPQGPEQLVSNPSSGTAALIDMDVAALRVSDGSSGGYVVVWESHNSDGSDNSNSSIQGQLVSATGVPIGNRFQVNATIPGSQRKPAVTELSDGGFFVVWVAPELQGRRFNAAGAPRGDQFQVNTADVSIKDEPDATIGWDGVVAVVWEDAEIRARLFSSELSPLGPDFQVNTLTTGIQELARIGEVGPEGFLVTWSSINASVGTDTDYSVQTRLVNGPGTFVGPQAQYNVWETNNQYTPASYGWYGHVGSAWESVGNDQDPPPYDDHITGRHIEACIYCDDLEWGSAWRWAATLGDSP